MCGIAGAFFQRGTERDEHAFVASLCSQQRTRGPDGEGLWHDPAHRLCLGHRRLAIIETGDDGTQPMADSTGRYLITFNGEIYNYIALRAELQKLGYRFATRTDTEVILAAFVIWGAPAAFSRLRGMFALAIWDTQTQQLCVARDPFGIKPLYVAEGSEGLCFASSARALSRLPFVDATRDPAALVGFYLWGHVPEPFTWWSGVRTFPPGHFQIFESGKPVVAPEPFYNGRTFTPAARKPLLQADLRAALYETVQAHLVADVPVGIFLSGGIDSSAVAAAAAAAGQQKPIALTISFDAYRNLPIDEAPLAQDFAKSLGLQHKLIYINDLEMEQKLDGFLNAMDQPTIDGFNAFLVSSVAAKEGLKVALCGVGADELFGGYPSFKQIPSLLGWSQRLPLKSGGGIFDVLAPLAKVLNVSPKTFSAMKYGGSVINAYLLRRSLYLENQLEALLDASWLRSGWERLDTARQLSKSVAEAGASETSLHAQISTLESSWYLRNQLLRDWDWAGMAHGVEIRTPFVDVEFAHRLDPFVGSARPPSKRDLAAAASLPMSVSARPKTGFTTPLSQHKHGLKPWADRVYRHFRYDEAQITGQRTS